MQTLLAIVSLNLVDARQAVETRSYNRRSKADGLVHPMPFPALSSSKPGD